MLQSNRDHTLTVPKEGFTLEDNPLLWSVYLDEESMTFVRDDGSVLTTRNFVAAGSFLNLLQAAGAPINPIYHYMPFIVGDGKGKQEEPKPLKWVN